MGIEFKQEASYVTTTDSIINTVGDATRSPQLIENFEDFPTHFVL